MRWARHISGVAVVLAIAAIGTVWYTCSLDGFWLYRKLLNWGGYDG